MLNFDTIVIGAGAAGFMAAITVAKQGKKVAIINSTSKIGEKIRISGGGRCNFTNIGASAENYISGNPHFVKSALAGYGPDDFIKLVEKHRIKFFEKKLGQLFCEESSQLIIDMLLKEADDSGVEIFAPLLLDKVLLQDSAKARFKLESSKQIFICHQLIIATGGLSIPATGASDFAYRIAREFDINVLEPRPGLVPLVLDDEFVRSQSGTSFDSVVQAKKKYKFRENILLTHKGLSGPAILQISNYIKAGEEFVVDLCPDLDIKKLLLEAKQKGEKRKLKNYLLEIKASDYARETLKTKIQRENIFPEKFIDALANDIDLDKSLAEVSNKVFDELELRLKRWTLKPCGDEGYAKAEVTLGGIDTKELNSQNMESRKVPGLHFIGEAVDVTGWLGGYNFQWAWSSGFVAGSI